MERRKVGGNASLEKRRSMVITSTKFVRSAINDRDLKWRSMVSEKAEIGMVRAAKSKANIHIGTMDDVCPKGYWHCVIRQN